MRGAGKALSAGVLPISLLGSLSFCALAVSLGKCGSKLVRSHEDLLKAAGVEEHEG